MHIIPPGTHENGVNGRREAGSSHVSQDSVSPRLIHLGRPDPVEQAGLVTPAASEIADDGREFNSFVQGIAEFAHSLRNSLTVISGSSELVMASEDSEARLFAGMIHEESAHLARLSQELLDYCRLKAGKFRLEPRWIDLSHLAREAGAAASRQSEAVAIEVLTPRGAALVYADPASLRQAVDILLQHLIEHAPANSTIRLRIELRNGPDCLTLLRLETQGRAASDDELARMFTPFARPCPTGSRSRRTWLGLAVARAILEAQGGDIWVENHGKGGTAFTFSLPGADSSALAS